MEQAYLAVDIGASSGRHILGWMEDGRIRLEEIWRFDNHLVRKNGHLCWDREYLFGQIIAGLKRCGELGRIPVSVGIDTWGVDFVLLDTAGQVIGDTIAYRDSRTQGMDTAVFEKIPESDLYARTGIQKAIFNTIYQLEALRREAPQQLEGAEHLLLLPDYFHYRLTGVLSNEYTNASTTGLLNAAQKDWDRELLDRLGFPQRLFGPLSLPGTRLGRLSPEIREELGFDCQVVLPGTHDTASAVAAAPLADQHSFYISSGTWSLMGLESLTPNTSEESRQRDFTNEGGIEYRFRYLKNIMGLWMIQSIRRELDHQYSFSQLCDMAQKARIDSLVDVNDSRFLAPDSMIDAIKGLCAETGQQIPQSAGETARVVYQSLARSYGETIRELEEITGRTCHKLHIVGGGSKDDYLNLLTARVTGKEVYAGPTEATALGNLLAQMLADGVFPSLAQGREAIRRSFDITKVNI